MEPHSHSVELSDIFRQFSGEFHTQYTLCSDQRKAYLAIMNCRTPAMGIHLATCNSCGYQQICYNSCRNRHCPKCQYLKQQIWIDQLKSRLLPTRYFHAVFTVPVFLNGLFYLNQKHCYDLLFKASAQAVAKTTANPAFLGAQSGHLSILHTWGQNLDYHPHLHLLIPAGGLDPDGLEWVNAPKKFFVPVSALAGIYRGIFMKLLHQSLKSGLLKIPEKDQVLYSNSQVLKAKAYEHNWHVHINKTFKGSGQVVTYLGRYTHRVAISNNRLLALENDQVTFRWKDYRDYQWKIMKLDAICFIRRFLLHILPGGFYKIRYYGIFAAIHTQTKMAQCFALLNKVQTSPAFRGLSMAAVLQIVTGRDVCKCPKCGKGIMIPCYDPIPVISAPT